MRPSRLLSLASALLAAAFLPTAPAKAAALAPEIGEARPLAPDAFGYNVNLVRGHASYDEPDFAEAVASLVPGNLRYPGGTVGNFWDWRRGGFIEGSEKIPERLPGDFSGYGLAQLKAGISVSGATPVFMLNLMTSSLEEQLAMLRAARELGLPVKYVELGNEHYHDRPVYTDRFPTGADYARECMTWARAIRAEFPEARIAIVGAAIRPEDPPRRKEWDRAVFEAIDEPDLIDAVVYHVYQGPGLATAPPANRRPSENAESLEGTELQAAAPGPDARTSVPAQQRQAEAFAAPSGPGTMLAMAYNRLNEFPEVRAVPHDWDVWITEYGMFDRTGSVWTTWAHGLFSALMTMRFLEIPSVELWCYHSIGGTAMFSALLRGEGDFSNRKTLADIETKRHGLSASGQTLRLLNRAARGATGARGLRWPGVAAPTGHPSGLPVLYGWLFTHPDGNARAAVLNLSDSEQTLDLASALGRENVTVEVFAPGIRERITGHEPLPTPTAADAKAITLPPYAMIALGVAD